MTDNNNSEPVTQTREPLPLILIRGFGGLDTLDERKNAYQGFNEGTVYSQKQGENYIYEGMILRFMKSNWRYQDATNIVNYYSKEIENKREHIPLEQQQKLQEFDETGFFSKSKIVIDPAMALNLISSSDDPRHTLWVFRYYDLGDRAFKTYGAALVRLIDFIRKLVSMKQAEQGTQPTVNKVNIIAHSMGGLIVRQAVQCAFRDLQNRAGRDADKVSAEEAINKIVTLGTPHQGISFQVLQELSWLPLLDADDELEQFNPKKQEDPANQAGFKRFQEYFPLDRLLTVVGTNYRSYDIGSARLLNRLFSVEDEDGLTYNRSDGLVKQKYAQIPGAPRTFIHKCHSGTDSVINSREAFEVSTRFFFGDLRTRIRLIKGNIKSEKGKDFLGKSEYFFGLSVKPRAVDFELFHQSREAENCYGPFNQKDLSDANIKFDWAGVDRLIWEGYLRRSSEKTDLVLRLQFYVSERDVFGIGFSDNIIFLAHYFVRANIKTDQQVDRFEWSLYNDENFDVPGKPMTVTQQGWEFEVVGRGFEGTFRIELDAIPTQGSPQPVLPTSPA